jgi:hypothetical protein
MGQTPGTYKALIWAEAEGSTLNLFQYVDITIAGSPISEGNLFAWDLFNRGVDVDKFGNAYITGGYSENGDLDPTPGVDIPGGCGVFLCKLDSEGNYKWGHVWGNEISTDAAGVATDSAGNVYVIGGFMGTVDFDPGDGVDEHEPDNYWLNGYFLSKFNTDGEFQWARTWAGYGEPLCPICSVTVDGNDCVYAAGDYHGSYDFDPGPGVDQHTSWSKNAFISKFDADGNFMWARTWGDDQYILCMDIDTGGADTVCVCGMFDGEIDFDPGPGEDIHVKCGPYFSKFDTDGNYQWAVTFDFDNYLINDAAGVAIDNSGDIYVTGFARPAFDFDPGPGTAETYGVFLGKFDPDGNFIWGRDWAEYNFDGSIRDYIYHVELDSLGNPYVAGRYWYLNDFDPGPGFYVDGYGSFISKFNPSGEFQWVRTVFNDVFDLAIGPQDNSYVTGFSDIGFDMNPGPEKEYPPDSTWGFLFKLNPDGTW